MLKRTLLHAEAHVHGTLDALARDARERAPRANAENAWAGETEARAEKDKADPTALITGLNAKGRDSAQ